MIFDRIDKLQQEPPEKRRRMAFVISIVLTGIIVVVWLITLTVRLPFGNDSAEVQPQTETPDPFDVLREGLRESTRVK